MKFRKEIAGAGLLVVMAIAVIVVGSGNQWLRCKLGGDGECPSKHSPSATNSIPLKGFEASEVGADYSKLNDLLAAGDFLGADEETAKIMLWAALRDKEGWIRDEDLETFPCKDLRTIDKLWLKHSGGKFGFSIQNQIWKEVGGTGEFDWDIYERFGDRVGWRFEELEFSPTYDLRGKKGHLPIGDGLHYDIVEHGSGAAGWPIGRAVRVMEIARRTANCRQ